MKVSSAPFEAPVGSSTRGQGSDGLARPSSQKTSLHLVSAPSSNSSVRAGLDAATRDALLRLANLAKEKDEEGEKEKPKSSERQKKNVISANDVIAVESIKEFHPASFTLGANESSLAVLERVRLEFEAARKQFGRQVYREAVKRQTMVELDKEFNLDLNIEELGSLSNTSDRSASTEDAIGFSGTGLKRVA
jgi:hypothetical protein